MKSVILSANRTVRVEETPKPSLAADEVMIKTAYAGICGSDIHAFRGRHPFRKPPVPLGHEISGVVEAVGKEVTDRTVGEHVTVMPSIACGTCPSCRAGRPNICRERVLPGTKGWGGTFSEFFAAKSSITYPLGNRTDLREGALAEPLAVGVHAAKVDGKCEGKDIAVLGAGAIGLFTGLACRRNGARSIVVSDMYDFNLGIARELFAGRGCRADSDTLLEEMLDGVEEGFDTVFMSSGASVNLEQAMDLVRPGGAVVVTGLYLEPVPMNLVVLTLREVRLLGSQIYTDADFREALEILNDERTNAALTITACYPYSGAQTAFEDIVGRKRDNVKTLLSFAGEDSTGAKGGLR